MPNILFVCHANRFRSVLAAEHFRRLLAGDNAEADWTVSSAGVWATEGIPPLRQAIQFAAAKQMDVSHVRSREINAQLVAEADLILVMEESQREAITIEFPGAKNKTCLLSTIALGENFNIPDPMLSLDEDPDVIAEEIINILNSGYQNIISRFNQQA